jgi:predicted outer membrane protein
VTRPSAANAAHIVVAAAAIGSEHDLTTAADAAAADAVAQGWAEVVHLYVQGRHLNSCPQG